MLAFFSRGMLLLTSVRINCMRNNFISMLLRNLVIPTELIVMVRMYHHDEVLSSMVKVVSCFSLTWPCRDISMLNRKLFMIVVMAGIGFHEMDDKATGPCRRWNIFGGVRSTAAVDTSYAQDLDQSLKGRQTATARGATFHVIIGRRHRASTASGFRTDLVVGAQRGILDLHEDVQTCGYEDVQVMWNMLSSEKEAAPAPPPRKRALWRLRLPVWPAAVWSPRGRGMQQREPNPTAACNFAM
uniref:Uncharacterized protein n=1 Tax=Oryza meridionalis TaxID=40149 RepID=A0A0E0E4P9_9ORYZ